MLSIRAFGRRGYGTLQYISIVTILRLLYSNIPLGLYEPVHKISVLIISQSKGSGSHTQSMDVNESSDQTLDL